jgi:phage protein D
MSDADVARQVFGEYGFQVTGDAVEDTAQRSEDRSVIMQRGTDADLLRMLARRNGFEVFVESAQQEIKPGGDAAAQSVAHFHRARPETTAQPPLSLTPHELPTIEQMTARWESHRPAILRGQHIDEQTRRIRTIEIAEPRFPRMGKVGRAAILKERLAAILPRRPETRPVGLQHVDVPHDPGETDRLAWSDFVAADWLVEAQAVIRASGYPQILRSRRPVAVAGAGKLLDGTWYVKTARHTWSWDTDDDHYRVEVELARDALSGVG